jgi:hypothetical protein
VYVVEEYICGISENAETLNVSKLKKKSENG